MFGRPVYAVVVPQRGRKTKWYESLTLNRRLKATPATLNFGYTGRYTCTMADFIYRYVATFPMEIDKPRPDWPVEAVGKLGSLPGMLNWVANDPTNAWQQDGRRLESRARTIHAELKATSQAEANKQRAAFEALMLELASKQPVYVSWWPVEASKVT